MNEPDDPVEQREVFLPLLLGTLATGFFFLFLILITGGFFFYVGLSIGGLVMLGLFHYALWGKALSDQVSGERDAVDLMKRAQEPPEQKWTFRR
jgi:hypothetical protein